MDAESASSFHTCKHCYYPFNQYILKKQVLSLRHQVECLIMSHNGVSSNLIDKFNSQCAQSLSRYDIFMGPNSNKELSQLSSSLDEIPLVQKDPFVPVRKAHLSRF